MDESLEIKSITESGVPEALRKAERYRLLNEPEQAESICLDVLAMRPDEPQALVTLILALTDQFGRDGGRAIPAAKKRVEQLADEYGRCYYSGLVAERQARAQLHRGMARVFAYEGFREAMGWYEKAEGLRAPGNDDPVLRWNSCLRTIRRERLRPHEMGPEHALE
jgi:hypothetical protein